MTSPSPPAAAKPSRAHALAVGGVVLVLVIAGILIGSEQPPIAARGGQALPRIPMPPASPTALLRRLGVGSVTWYACVLTIPILWWLAWRFPLTQKRPARALALHLAAVALLVLLASAVHYRVAYKGSPFAPGFLDFAPVALAASGVPLLAVAALVHGLEARRRGVRHAIEAQRLRAELAESRLAAVTTQLHPHFLFNTLQGISTLIHRDPAAADAMLARLSDLLRDVLRRSHSGLTTLGDELRMVQTYLDLARIRFGERLRVDVDVDPAATGAMVPVLLLQPLVENALKHGVGRRATGGCVGISARRVDGHLALTVWDDGAGLEHGSQPRERTGLGNTRERLRYAFGDDQAMELRPRPGGGVEVAIRLPLRTAGTASA